MYNLTLQHSSPSHPQINQKTQKIPQKQPFRQRLNLPSQFIREKYHPQTL